MKAVCISRSYGVDYHRGDFGLLDIGDDDWRTGGSSLDNRIICDGDQDNVGDIVDNIVLLCDRLQWRGDGQASEEDSDCR